jgi:hypothetical protein
MAGVIRRRALWPGQKSTGAGRACREQVLKQVHPDTGISRQAMLIMEDYIFHLARQIIDEVRAVGRSGRGAGLRQLTRGVATLPLLLHCRLER